MREIQEECGLDVILLTDIPGKDGPSSKALHRPNFVNFHHSYTKGHYHIDLRYVLLANSVDPTLEEADHNDIRWFTRHDLYSPEYKIEPHDRWYCLEAIKIAKAHNKSA